MRSTEKYLWAVALTIALVTGGCGDSGSEADPLAGMQSNFTHKMMQSTLWTLGR